MPNKHKAAMKHPRNHMIMPLKQLYYPQKSPRGKLPDIICMSNFPVNLAQIAPQRARRPAISPDYTNSV